MTATPARAPAAAVPPIRVLALSQHEAVRRQLVDYLGRKPALTAKGAGFSAGTILQERPDVLVLDLSQLGTEALLAAIGAAGRVGAGLIALASMRDPAEEGLVVAAGGRYCLKSAGAGGLAELVRELAIR